MSRTLPTRRMTEHPDLDQLKRQAKELLREFLAGQPEASAEVRAHYDRADPAAFALHDAQLVLARSYGFDSWPKLKAYVDGVTIRRLADAAGANDLALARAMLQTRPELANMALSYGDERRPIHFAVISRAPEMVRLLLEHGASAREGVHPHRESTTAWVIAKDRSYDEIVALIEHQESLQKAADDDASEPEPPALRGDEEARAAVAAGNIESLRARHAAGNFTNPVRWHGGGLLTVAVRHDRPEILRLLLDYGFDPNERVSEGEGDWIAYSQGFPLWNCAAMGCVDLAEILLDHGADPNVHVDSSGSSVYSAYSHKQWKMVDLLLSRGGKVTIDIAAIYRQVHLVREILAAGNVDLAQALYFAGMGGGPETVEAVLDHIDWPRDEPQWFRMLCEPLCFWNHMPGLSAANNSLDRGGYLRSFRLILDRCDPNIVGSFGRTILHEVAAMGDYITEDETAPFAEALLAAGAKVGPRDQMAQSTALGWACRAGRARVAQVLLENGADPIEADAEPWARPRAWAQKRGHAGIVELLRKHGG